MRRARDLYVNYYTQDTTWRHQTVTSLKIGGDILVVFFDDTVLFLYLYMGRLSDMCVQLVNGPPYVMTYVSVVWVFEIHLEKETNE